MIEAFVREEGPIYSDQEIMVVDREEGPIYSDQEMMDVLQHLLQESQPSSFSSSNDDRFNGIDENLSIGGSSSNNSCASETKFPKKHCKSSHHPKRRIDTAAVENKVPPKSVKLHIPDIPKSDVRTRYGQMYLNVLNGHDLQALPDYVNRYFTPNCTQSRGIRVFNPLTKSIDLHNLASFTTRDIITFSMGTNFETTPDIIVTCQKELIRPIRDTKNMQITLKVHFEGSRYFQIDDAYSEELSRCINMEITAEAALNKLKTLEYKVALSEPVSFLTDGIMTLCINEEGHIYHLGFAISSSNKPGQEWSGEEQIILKFAQQNRNMYSSKQQNQVQQQQSSCDLIKFPSQFNNSSVPVLKNIILQPNENGAR
jgi:hypothetical protein